MKTLSRSPSGDPSSPEIKQPLTPSTAGQKRKRPGDNDSPEYTIADIDMDKRSRKRTGSIDSRSEDGDAAKRLSVGGNRSPLRLFTGDTLEGDDQMLEVGSDAEQDTSVEQLVPTADYSSKGSPTESVSSDTLNVSPPRVGYDDEGLRTDPPFINKEEILPNHAHSLADGDEGEERDMTVKNEEEGKSNLSPMLFV